MGLRIQNNVEAFNTHRQLSATSTQASKAMADRRWRQVQPLGGSSGMALLHQDFEQHQQVQVGPG